ncbi:hypothetical protein AB0C96_22120 [Streptomyces sp. NPDC048506]|uniref:hypothetical protein n=1 Tax=Streptomyces sp. NPDC048506 TaxID=3155028 RepID=UPI003444FA1C
MTRVPPTAALWGVRGLRRVRVLPGGAVGAGAPLAVAVSVAGSADAVGSVPGSADAVGSVPGSADAVGSVPACAWFGGNWTGGHGAVPAGADEHFAVDAERCTEERWLACADVLHGSRPWPAESAVGWVRDVLCRYTGCRLAGLPLIGGGWAVAERLGHCRMLRSAFLRPALPRPGRARAAWEYSLMASCLYGLVVTGHPPEELLPLTVLTLAPSPVAETCS